MKLILMLALTIGCVNSEMKDASKQLHLNKTRFEQQIDMINNCLKKGGLSDNEIKIADSKKILESRQIETPQRVCANYTTATLEPPIVRRCRYLLHPTSTIELCLNKARQDNNTFREWVAQHCRSIQQQLNKLSTEEIEKRNLEYLPIYRWLKNRRCDDENYDAVHDSAGSGEG